MLHKKLLVALCFGLLGFSPGLVLSQEKPIVFFDVSPGAEYTVVIQWRMAAGSDTLPFQVERSRDQVSWERIGSMVSQSTHQYSCKDLQPGEGLLYYRVGQLSQTGDMVYSTVKWVQISKAGKLIIWPNPAHDRLYVKTPFAKGRLDVVDTGGKTVFKMDITNYVSEVPTGHFPGGIYFLHIRYKNENMVQRFVKD